MTDRPDFTESPVTVGPRVVQFEGGATYAEFASGTDVTTLGELLVRWGLAPKFELRFLLPTYARERSAAGDGSGFIDTGVGFKYEFAQGAGSGILGGMEAAVIAATSLPTASGDFDSKELMPLIVAALGWELGANTGLGANLGLARPVTDDERFTSAWASTALGVGLGSATSAFFELYGYVREEPGGPGTATFQTGLVHLLSDDLQLDLRVARRLSERGPDLLLGAGVSWRIGHREP